MRTEECGRREAKRGEELWRKERRAEVGRRFGAAWDGASEGCSLFSFSGVQFIADGEQMTGESLRCRRCG